MIYNISHKTTYEYSDTVSLSHHFLRLCPRPLPHQECNYHRLRIVPAPSSMDHRVDYFGNPVTFFTIETPHRKLEIVSENSKVSVKALKSHVPAETPSWNIIRDLTR